MNKFNHDMEAVLTVLSMKDKKAYSEAKAIIDLGIPIEPWQINLMYLQRGYGKTFFSYSVAAVKLVREGEISIAHGKSRDPDAHMKAHQTSAWRNGFADFLVNHTKINATFQGNLVIFNGFSE